VSPGDPLPEDRTSPSSEDIHRVVEEVYRTESRRVLATLIRLLGDFELAEDALQEAFAAAVARWPETGVPSNPRAWLVSAGRFRGLDVLRRRTRYGEKLGELAREGADPGGLGEGRFGDPSDVNPWDGQDVADDQLRLIFTCCHPALGRDAQVALTLREVCGLTTEEIARAFLVPAPTLAQRIVRAKRKIRAARIPYEVPGHPELPERLGAVLRVVYLVFNEGYSASSGEAVTRGDLSGEAIRLGRLLVDLLPEPEAMGLLGMMLLHEARREARNSPDGDLILLEDQDRARWDREAIAEGVGLVERALTSGRIGPYALQAAIAAVHAEAASAEETDWPQIVALYDLLQRVSPSPVVALNRAVAVAMRDGPAAGLRLVEGLREEGELEAYHLLHAVEADLCRRLGRTQQARAAYRRALELATQDPERRFLEGRLAELRD
jgi:RNA polymerase sigma-70 factor, ECF subfamily